MFIENAPNFYILVSMWSKRSMFSYRPERFQVLAEQAEQQLHAGETILFHRLHLTHIYISHIPGALECDLNETHGLVTNLCHGKMDSPVHPCAGNTLIYLVLWPPRVFCFDHLVVQICQGKENKPCV